MTFIFLYQLYATYVVKIFTFGSLMWKRNVLVAIYFFMVARNCVNFFVQELYNSE